MEKNAKVFVAGHETMAGAAILRRAKAAGYRTVLPQNPDLTDQKNVFDFFNAEKPDYVFIASAKGRRDISQQPVPGRIYLSEYPDADERNPCRVEIRGEEAALPGQFLHVPQSQPPTHERRISDDRTARTDERTLCYRQDRRIQDVPGLQTPVRGQFHRGSTGRHVRTDGRFQSRKPGTYWRH